MIIRLFILALASLAGCASLPTLKSPPTGLPTPVLPQAITEALPPPMPLAKTYLVATERDLWTRFRDRRHWQPCELTPGVQAWIGRYAASRKRFAQTLAPTLPLMDYVLTRSEVLGLPGETMLLPIVESYYRPDARGPGGALGLWQLMPATARHLGLKPDGGADPRTDVIASTRAALTLLKANADKFERNPKLMYAAYNAGDHRVRKALNGRDMQTLTSLDGLGLTKTTRDYLDKVKALGCLLGEPERFDLELPTFAVDSRLAEFTPSYPIDPQSVFLLAGMDSKFASAINRSASQRRMAGPDKPLLVSQVALETLRAADTARQFAMARPRAVPNDNAAVSKTRVHRVVSGDSLWTIARRYRVKLGDLMQWNGLSKRSVLRLGQEIRLSSG